MKNLYKKILIALFFGAITIVPVLTFVLMPKGDESNNGLVFSENENRYLARFVNPSLRSIKTKTFMEGFDNFFADRFLFREDFISTKNKLERVQGKDEINGVFITNDRMIEAFRVDEEVAENINHSLDSMDSFAEVLRETYDTESYVMLIPSSQEMYMDTLPLNSHLGEQSSIIKNCYDSLDFLTRVDATTYLTENAGNYIYYRTDHHWTTYGAYWGYYAAGKKLGFTPYDMGKWEVFHPALDFRGTLFSKTLDYDITPDTISIYSLSGKMTKSNTKMKVFDGLKTTEYDTLYFNEFLEKKDKYSVFLGGNEPLVEITTDNENGKSLLVFKDSFANCMIPFLAEHYSRITVLDMRYINAGLETLVDFEGYPQVLFVYGLTGFADDENLTKLPKSLN